MAVVPTLEHQSIFSEKQFNTVVDVGANKGQFSLFASVRWPDARIFAFEPLPDQAAKFQKVHGNTVKLFNCALGTEKTEVEMHVASRKDSSSLLPLSDQQKKLFSMDEIASFAVPVERLDNLIKANEVVKPALLKIDVQGYEYEVLCGAQSILSQFDCIFVEVSFTELYTGQKLFPDINALLEDAGFQIEGKIVTGYGLDNQEVQADLLYTRLGRGH
ncbi:FkbM family methyltransferase [Altericroceibacterium endophyticum]|nr:FkbM family methyltransferase [Altericroceibacterium endophyticum]